MDKYFVRYWNSLVRGVSTELLLSLILLFVIGCVLIFVKKGFRNGLRMFSGLILIEFVAFLFCTTLVMRSESVDREFNYMPFWSYITYIRGGYPYLLPENIMNVVVFVPIGLLLGIVYRNVNWQKVVFVGFGISFFIEIMQFILKRGFSELDDVMHNTLGCIIGYAIYKIAASLKGSNDIRS